MGCDSRAGMFKNSWWFVFRYVTSSTRFIKGLELGFGGMGDVDFG
jgi:hypothetical protein